MSDQNPTRYDELNLARLNLISAQDSVGGQSSWTERFEYAGRAMEVHCMAFNGLEVPHGVDNDVSAALLDLFVEAGMPHDGVLEVAASELRRRAGFHNNGHYLALLRESLDRLYYTNYVVSSGWREHQPGRWTNREFRIVSAREYTAKASKGEFDERTVLRIQLGEPLVLSMRGGYVKPLNITFMHSLSRPRTRVLFRALDAMRYDPEKPDLTVDQFEVGLIEWSDHLKIPSARPDMVRRALQPLHDELIRRGYLRDVQLEGRGSKQRLRYVFAPDFFPVSPAVLEALRRHGIAEGVALSLGRAYSSTFLLQRVQLFESMTRSGALKVKKTPAHALVHMIKHPDQYPTPETPSVRAEKRPAREAIAPVRETSLSDELAGLDVNAQGDVVVKRLGILFPRKFRTAELDELRARVERGEVDAHALLTEAFARMARIEGQEFVQELRVALQAST